MYIDILIFAVVAAFLIYRLNSVLGTRHGEERDRKNPFDRTQAEESAADKRDGAVIDGTALHENQNVVPLAGADRHIDASLNQDGRIETGLRDIANVDSYFEINTFMQGARGAFEMVVLAYSRGDLETLQPLLSPKLFGDFSAGIKSRLAQGHTNEVTIHRITSARIVEAHLGGTMAYVTVDFDVEETSVTRDSSGNIVDGSPDKIFSVEDIWTFTRDVRAADPNWTLIETRAAQK